MKFFQDLLKCLDSLALERDHRAITIFQKAPVQLYTSESALHHYQLLFTPYAISFLKEQFDVAKKISEDAGTAESNVLQSSEGLLVVSALSCQCSFFKAMKLPCRHVFSHRITHNMELFDKIFVQRDGQKIITMKVTGYFHLILYRTLAYQFKSLTFNVLHQEFYHSTKSIGKLLE